MVHYIHDGVGYLLKLKSHITHKPPNCCCYHLDEFTRISMYVFGDDRNNTHDNTFLRQMYTYLPYTIRLFRVDIDMKLYVQKSRL